MYQHILVPLDGSELSEAVLPHAQALAEKLGATLLLVRVANVSATVMAATGPDTGMVAPDLIEEVIEDQEDEGKAYLERVTQRLKDAGCQVSWQLVEGSPAHAIVETAKKNNCDLIAMATHGRSGLQRAVLGSVADAVARDSHLPVLLIRPPVPAP
ncbi:MAG TPA: universal stress protein [Chloroflexota bacterium]|jgi:nucleotide-binding universal stress UspA family protein